MPLTTVSPSVVEAPSVFSPQRNFGAGGDARRLVELEPFPAEGLNDGRSAIYAHARDVAERQALRRVVDLGTGTGNRLMEAFAGFEGALIQTDRKDGRLPHPEATAHFVSVQLEDTGDLQHLADELTNEIATLYILADKLERLMDPRALLRVLRLLLRLNPANRLVLSTPERPENNEGLPDDPRHVRQWTSVELEGALRSGGFVVHHLDRVPLDVVTSGGFTVLAEVGCTLESYRGFLARHQLPVPVDHLVITTEPGVAALDGSAPTQEKEGEKPAERPLCLFTGAEGLPEDWRPCMKARGWMHSAQFTGLENASCEALAPLDGEQVLNAVFQVVFLYDELRLVQYQDYRGLGALVAQAKRARLLPPSVAVVATAVGSHFYLDRAQDNISKTRDLRVDVRERLSLELADAVLFPSRFLRDLYMETQGLELRHHIVLPHPAWSEEKSLKPGGAKPAHPMVLTDEPWPQSVQADYAKTLEALKAYTPKARVLRGALTVVTPNFNGKAHFFRDFICGLHHSYYRPQEVVFVDDGSNEEGFALLQQAAADLAPIPAKILRTPENLGSSKARNLGLGEVTTPYLCAHDNDNFAGNRFLDLACRILDENPDVAVVTTWMLLFRDGEGWLSAYADKPAHESRPVGPDLGLGFRINCFGDTMAVYRVAALRAMGGWDTSLEGRFEDMQLFLRLTALGQKIWVLPTNSFFYRIQPHSRSHTKSTFDGWMRRGRAIPGLPYNKAFGLVRAVHLSVTEEAARLNEQVNEQAARLQALESSTTWRASSAARRFIGHHPTLHLILRQVLGVSLRLARRLRL